MAAEAASEQKPSGVIHGTATGTRLRPEDESTTDAQFQGQADMYERRKLIDELIATGVPAISANEAGERRSPALALLYLLIPILAIAFLLAQNDSAPATAEPAAGGGSGALTLTASNVSFNTDSLSVAAGKESTLHFTNDDSVAHNFSIYEDDTAAKNLFKGQETAGGSETDYQIPALDPGEYYFHCDLHPTSMEGTLTVK
jgi:plastocyanin